MSDAADRILQRYATLYGDSGPAQTRDEYIVARRVKELEAKLAASEASVRGLIEGQVELEARLEEQQRVCRVITRIRQKAQARLDRMRKAFGRTGKQLLAMRAECMGGAYWPVPEHVLKKLREYGVWRYGADEQPEDNKPVLTCYRNEEFPIWELTYWEMWPCWASVEKWEMWRYIDPPPEHVLRRLRGET